MTNAANLTKTQTATLDKIRILAADGGLDVTYGGIKGVNRSALWALEGKGLLKIERTMDSTGSYATQMIATLV
jgi:hypothetical protein